MQPPPDPPAPRALLRRFSINVQLSPFELALLIEELEARACRAADNWETVDLAAFWFGRVAELREASR
jgi:hypothetical protein